MAGIEVEPALWAEGLGVQEGVGVEVVDVGARRNGGLKVRVSD